MKKIVVLLIAVMAMGKLRAQDTVAGKERSSPPTILYTLDTTLFRPSNYKLSRRSKIKNLFKLMDGYYLEKDSSIIHWGQDVKHFAINGKNYSGLNVMKAIKILSVDMLAYVESVIDYKNAMSMGPRTPIIDETLNINIKENKIAEAQQLLFAADILGIDEKVTKIRLDCRDYFSEALAQLPINRDAPPEPDTDDYGDQIPHFIIKPAPGTWISKATVY